MGVLRALSPHDFYEPSQADMVCSGRSCPDPPSACPRPSRPGPRYVLGRSVSTACRVVDSRPAPPVSRWASIARRMHGSSELGDVLGDFCRRRGWSSRSARRCRARVRQKRTLAVLSNCFGRFALPECAAKFLTHHAGPVADLNFSNLKCNAKFILDCCSECLVWGRTRSYTGSRGHFNSLETFYFWPICDAAIVDAQL
jgi:hypothetical protein